MTPTLQMYKVLILLPCHFVPLTCLIIGLVGGGVGNKNPGIHAYMH